jgi:hypothetical protein
MTRVGRVIAGTALTALLWPATAAADSLRCGTKVITDGDAAVEVTALCGPPDSVTRSEVWRRPVLWRYGRPYYLSHEPLPVAVEFWTYNFGPHKLMRRVRIEDGIVTDIETLGHGYHDD